LSIFTVFSSDFFNLLKRGCHVFSADIDPRTRNRIVAMQLLSLGFPRITTAALHSKLEVTLLELSQQAPDCKVGNLYALHTLYDRVTF
jgi:hypothetical protein